MMRPKLFISSEQCGNLTNLHNLDSVVKAKPSLDSLSTDASLLHAVSTDTKMVLCALCCNAFPLSHRP